MAGNVRVRITGDASGLDRATADAERSLKRMRKGMAFAATGAAGLAAGVAAIVAPAADFEQQMSTLASVSDASARQMVLFSVRRSTPAPRRSSPRRRRPRRRSSWPRAACRSRTSCAAA